MCAPGSLYGALWHTGALAIGTLWRTGSLYGAPGHTRHGGRDADARAARVWGAGQAGGAGLGAVEVGAGAYGVGFGDPGAERRVQVGRGRQAVLVHVEAGLVGG